LKNPDKRNFSVGSSLPELPLSLSLSSSLSLSRFRFFFPLFFPCFFSFAFFDPFFDPFDFFASFLPPPRFFFLATPPSADAREPLLAIRLELRAKCPRLLVRLLRRGREFPLALLLSSLKFLVRRARRRERLQVVRLPRRGVERRVRGVALPRGARVGVDRRVPLRHHAGGLAVDDARASERATTRRGRGRSRPYVFGSRVQ
jgi:hypothetical protein